MMLIVYFLCLILLMPLNWFTIILRFWCKLTRGGEGRGGNCHLVWCLDDSIHLCGFIQFLVGCIFFLFIFSFGLLYASSSFLYLEIGCPMHPLSSINKILFPIKQKDRVISWVHVTPLASCFLTCQFS